MLDRRQFLGTLGASALTLGLAGCGSDGESGSGAAGSYKVALVCDGSINDGGWGASCYQAMVDAADELGWETAYSESVSSSDWATTLENYVDQGYNMLFLPGAQYRDVAKQIADENPDCHMCILNTEVEGDNVESLVPDADQIGLLAGVLAGVLSKTNSIGFIGGTELDTTKTKLSQYTAAAQKINPSITVKSAYAGSFTDAAKGKELANSMLTNDNIDVMFGDASVVDTGAREALAGAEGVYDIGQPSDLGSADDELIACSVITDNKSMIKTAMEDVENGEFGGKTIKGDLSNGGVYLGTFSSIVTEDQQKQVEEYVEQVEAGTFL